MPCHNRERIKPLNGATVKAKEGKVGEAQTLTPDAGVEKRSARGWPEE